MDRKAFRQLLERYLSNCCTEEEARIVDQWYELLDKTHEPLSPDEIASIEDSLWNKIQAANEKQESRIQTKVRSIWWKYAAAVCFIAVIAIGFDWIRKTSTQTNYSIVDRKVNEGLIEEFNTSDTVETVRLEDGSSVLISPGAKMAYPEHFHINRREVFLEGDAFFTVAKNPNRPFFVYKDQIVTQVLGTSFDISSKNGQVEVSVKTGRVAVYENREQVNPSEQQQKSNGVIITPNQKVIYYQQERHFVTTVVNRPVPVVKDSLGQAFKSHFIYKDTPLKEILEDLQSTYGLEIILENEKLENCLFTGDLSEENLFNQLQAICLVFNASHEVKGTRILLTGGKDCTLN